MRIARKLTLSLTILPNISIGGFARQDHAPRQMLTRALSSLLYSYLDGSEGTAISPSLYRSTNEGIPDGEVTSAMSVRGRLAARPPAE